MSEKKYVRHYALYPVVDCEHEGDINHAKQEVADAGGIFDEVVCTDGDGDSDDYYESREWYIRFHCDSKEEYLDACEKLGL